jgi:hypothetical protein
LYFAGPEGMPSLPFPRFDPRSRWGGVVQAGLGSLLVQRSAMTARARAIARHLAAGKPTFFDNSKKRKRRRNAAGARPHSGMS